jgi:nucleotide-binding universal stress UspA family protein
MMRFPPRRILAAVDQSAASMRAWKAARELAERFGARLDAVHCEPPLGPELDVYPAEYASRREVLSDLSRRLGGAFKLRVERGWPEAVLPRLAKELRADLVVLGVTRRSGLQRAIMGSVAEAVVRDCPCPVLSVPRSRDIRRVLAPVNEGEYAKEAVLAAALVAKAYGARLELLHVVTDPLFGTPPRSLLRRRVRELPPALRQGVSCRFRLARRGPAADIVRAARGQDLVVLAEHRKSLVGDFVLGTTAERVLRRSTAPVLSIPSPRRGKGVTLI